MTKLWALHSNYHPASSKINYTFSNQKNKRVCPDPTRVYDIGQRELSETLLFGELIYPASLDRGSVLLFLFWKVYFFSSDWISCLAPTRDILLTHMSLLSYLKVLHTRTAGPCAFSSHFLKPNHIQNFRHITSRLTNSSPYLLKYESQQMPTLHAMAGETGHRAVEPSQLLPLNTSFFFGDQPLSSADVAGLLQLPYKYTASKKLVREQDHLSLCCTAAPIAKKKKKICSAVHKHCVPK